MTILFCWPFNMIIVIIIWYNHLRYFVSYFVDQSGRLSLIVPTCADSDCMSPQIWLHYLREEDNFVSWYHIWVYRTYSCRENGRFLTFDYKIDHISLITHTNFTINGSFERELISACKLHNYFICLTPKFCVRSTSFKNFELHRILKAWVSAHEF